MPLAQIWRATRTVTMLSVAVLLMQVIECDLPRTLNGYRLFHSTGPLARQVKRTRGEGAMPFLFPTQTLMRPAPVILEPAMNHKQHHVSLILVDSWDCMTSVCWSTTIPCPFQLWDLLRAFAAWDTSGLHYVQGMSYLAAVICFVFDTP